ncbi:MAG: S1C family serine protease [Phycisphaerae bacterium]
MNRVTHHTRLAAGGLLILALWASGGIRLQANPASDYTGHRTPPSMPQAAAFDRETRRMFDYVAHSLVEVHLSRDISQMLPPNLRRRFSNWEKRWVMDHHFRPMGPRTFGRGVPAITIEPDVDHGHHAEKHGHDADRWLARLKTHPIGQLFLLQRFLITKLHAFGNPHLMPILQAVHLRIQSYHTGMRNRVYGLVTGRHGHVLALSILGAGTPGETILVTTPDGRVCRASILGVDFRHDITELQLPKAVHVPGIALAPKLPRQAETVLAINGSAPGIKWMQLCDQRTWRPHGRHRSRIAKNNRRPQRGRAVRIGNFFQAINSPQFFIDVKGRLTAVSSNNSDLVAGGKFSILRQFITTGFTSGPQFGVKYRFLPMKSPLRARYAALGSQPAAEVQRVLPHSAARRAGIKRRDIILTIDEMPISKLYAIIRQARRRPDDIPVTLLRNGKMMTLTINLLPPHHRRPPAPVVANNPPG